MSLRFRILAIGATLALALSVVPGTTLAQEAGLRIVVIDGDRVTTETAVGRRVREQLQASADRWEQRVSEIQSELQTLRQRLDSQRLTLGQDALAQLSSQVEEAQVRLERTQDDARRALQREQADGIEQVNAVLVPALEELAAERGYDLVLDSRMTQTGGMLYYSQAIDITDEFIERVNAATPEPGGGS